MLKINNLAGFGANALPILTVGNVLGQTSAVLSQAIRNYNWTSLNIGSPQPRRRVFISFVTDYFPTSTMNIAFTVTVDGVNYEMTPFGNQSAPNGFEFTSAFSAYTTRNTTYISPFIPSGTTASILCTNGAISNGYGVAIKTVTNIKNITGPTSGATYSSGDTIIVPKNSYAYIRQTGTNCSTITATGFTARYRRLDTFGGWDALYYDYWNNTDSDYSVTVTTSNSATFALSIMT